MSVQARVEEWLNKMGYDGPIPGGLSKICNPSTAFIWEQLISNVKSRQEVDHARKSIIVYRLSQRPLEQQDEFSYPVKEIQTYMEKQKCEKHVKYLEKENEEKEGILDKTLNKSNIIYVTINSIKERIKEAKQKKFLLEKKSKIVEEDIQKAQEVLSLARNLTPVEMEASANTDEITQTLQKCAEKLQKHSDAISMRKAKQNRSMSVSKISTKTSRRHRKNTFSQHLNQSTVLTDIAPSCKKSRVGNKENLRLSQRSPMVSRCLKFSDCDSDVTKINTSPRTQKRDSLGLLTPDCLNTSEDVDAFLLSPPRTMGLALQPLSDSVFEPPMESAGEEILRKLRGDKAVKEILENLLHKNNRYLIVNECRNIYEELLKEIKGPMMEYTKLICVDRNIDQEDMTQLYSIHMKNLLENEKCRIILKKLQETVKKKKEDVLALLCTRSINKDEIIKIFELQIEEAFLNGGNNFLEKEINSSKKRGSDNEIQVINAKIKQAKEETVAISSCIESLISNTGKVLEDIKNNRKETYVCVRKLNPYIHDETWANVMTQGDHSEEIKLFKKFPVEYNRKFKYNNAVLSRINLSDTTIPPYVKLESNDLALLTKFMDAPFATSENVIFDFLQTRVSSNMLRSTLVELESPNDDYHKYTSEELRQREHFVEPVMDKLRSIINSREAKEVLGGPNYMKQVTALRVEAPFRNFISEKRQVEGHGYKFYENILKELKNK